MCFVLPLGALSFGGGFSLDGLSLSEPQSSSSSSFFLEFTLCLSLFLIAPRGADGPFAVPSGPLAVPGGFGGKVFDDGVARSSCLGLIDGGAGGFIGPRGAPRGAPRGPRGTTRGGAGGSAGGALGNGVFACLLLCLLSFLSFFVFFSFLFLVFFFFFTVGEGGGGALFGGGGGGTEDGNAKGVGFAFFD